MQVIITCMQFPTLYQKTKEGDIHCWKIWTEGNEIVSEYGQYPDGKMTIAREIVEGKNSGKKNATTPEEQAHKDAQAKWKKKLDKKYHLSVEDCSTVSRVDVMIAPTESFDKTKKYVKYPCSVQFKYDGNRCLAYWDGDEVVLQSRGRKFWNLPHIKEELKKIMPKDAWFDGELYVHGISRQVISSWLKKAQPESSKIELHIYDVPMSDGDLGKTWIERLDALNTLVSPTKETPHLVKSKTWTVHSEEEIYKLHEQAVKEGFEGIMVRNFQGVYEQGHRSKNLLKCKSFLDNEFKCIGYLTGSGKNADMATFVCITEAGQEFNVEPNMSHAERREMLTHIEDYIGAWLTVKYQDLSEDGIPQFPKVIGIRINEDIS